MLESMKKRRGGRVLGDGVANVIKLRKTKKNFTTKGTKNTKKRQDFFINPFVNFVLFVVKNSYLNDIERDRRNPSSEHLIRQFAKVLKIDADYLHYLAGKLPDEIRQKNLSQEAVKEAFMAFRKSHKK